MADTLHIPTFGKHLHTDNAADVLPRCPFLANGIDHLTHYGLTALVSVEYAGINLDRSPRAPVIRIRVAEQIVFSRKMLEEPTSAVGIVGNDKHDRTGGRSGKLKGLFPFLVIIPPGGIEGGNGAF